MNHSKNKEHQWQNDTPLEIEEWIAIDGYNGKYEISNLGRVRSKAKNKNYIMQQRLDKDGYLRVSLRDDKRKRNRPVHRLLAIAFIPNPQNLPQIDHINTIRTDNRLSNLRWATPKMNSMNELSVIHRSEVSKKLWANAEFKEKVSATNKAIKNTPEYIAKARELCRHKFKPVVQLDANGNIIKVWECIADASKNTPASRRGIKMVCRGLMQHSGGYKWKFI